MFERDYLMRQVRQLAEVLAKLSKLKREGQVARALEIATDAAEGCPIDTSIAEVVDGHTVLKLIGSAELVAALGRLTLERARLEARADQDPAPLFRRAKALLEAAKLGGEDVSIELSSFD